MVLGCSQPFSKMRQESWGPAGTTPLYLSHSSDPREALIQWDWTLFISPRIIISVVDLVAIGYRNRNCYVYLP